MAEFITPAVTLSWPKLHKAAPRGLGGTGDLAWSTAAIVSKLAQESEQFKRILAAMDEIIADKWPKAPKASIKLPFRDCAEKEGIYPGYKAGDLFFNTWSKNQPDVIDANTDPIITEAGVYGGQIARMFVSPYAWENNGRKGISLALGNVQILKDGPRLDGKLPAANAFGVWKDDAA